MSSPATLGQIHKIFPLTPLMAALLLTISPVHAQPLPVAVTSQETQPQQQPHAFRFHEDHILGTSFDMVVFSEQQQDAEIALQAARQEILRLEQILSIWQHDSEISQLNRTLHTQTSPELFEVISACEAWRDRTCGAFDARLGQLIALWQQQNAVQSLDMQSYGELLQQLHEQSITLNPDDRSIRINTNISFAPDGYAKGYIIDRALAVAQQVAPNVKGLLIDIGGDIRVWGQSPQAQGWQIGVQNAFNRDDSSMPDQVLSLNNQAIAFSGKGARDVAGQSHLLDPATGLSVQHSEQCVVVGHCAADADALATALATLSPSQGLELIESLIGYEAQIVNAQGEVFQSSGWQQLVNQNPVAQLQEVRNSNSKASSWPSGYQANLELTIPKINIEKYRPPYVAVWVTDQNNKLVRTLAIWGAADKWTNSNYVWWRRYGSKLPNLDAIAKPTRQPGQYNLSWDGKDDNGNAVAAGKYTVHVEITREFGEHSYQKLDLNAVAKDSAKSLPAQKEIGELKLKFQRSI